MNYAGKFDAALSLDGQGSRSPGHDHVDSFTAKAHGHVPEGAVVIADPNLIFHGEFKRTGVDLVLSHDGHEFVVHDYFRGDKRAAIASPDGAHLTGDIVNALTGHVQYAQAAPGIAAAQVIGHVTKLTGSATAIRNGVSVILNNGDNVEKGDVVSTGSDSTLGVTFIDGTVFGLSSNARMVLNEMVYDPNGSNNSSLLSLVAGTITFVAGETAKHGDMKIDTPVATMGIRGTAVLTEINFVVPSGGGDPQPQANFQVLVEPNGTTGSYILFDKLTLLPIATVNQAGQMIQISGGNVSVTNALLSPDVQKLITDVFTLKFTDNNTNTKLTTNFTDSITQDGNNVLIKTASGATAQATFTNAVNNNGNGQTQSPADKTTAGSRIPAAFSLFMQSLDADSNPKVAFGLTEVAGQTGVTAADVVIGKATFVDFNLGDRPTVKVLLNGGSYVYTDAAQHDVTAGLSALQKQDILATEVKINVVPGADNDSNGYAIWTFSVPDNAFDFLAAGETLTLKYTIIVNNNFLDDPGIVTKDITITITGTNDKPVITSGAPTITFEGGTSVPGGPLTSHVPTSGTLAFTDVDLTDVHSVSVVLSSASLPGGTVPPGPLAIFQHAMSVLLEKDSTQAGNNTGIIDWSLADLPAYVADFIPKGEVLTLTYTVTLTDSQGATSTQTITVTIKGTDSPAVVWIATKETGAPSGGLWGDKLNWETHTVPTINDDVMVITDQLRGLTPSYPVTIDAAAFAKSLIMDDYNTSPPELINNSTLTIAGALTLNADSKFTNSVGGHVLVGGKIDVEATTRSSGTVTNTSTITNAGTLTLAGGGTIDTRTTISNSGMIDLSGGTLALKSSVANVGGTLKADAGAMLIVDTATVDGGTVTILGTLELDGTSLIGNGTLNNSGTVNVKGAVEFANEFVSNDAGGTIEVFAHDDLKIDLGSRVNNTGNVKVDASGKLTVNGATIDGGAITILPGTPEFGGGVSDASGSTVIFTVPSIGTVTNNGELDLTGSGVLSNGILKNNNTLNVTGTGNALTSEAVTNAGTIEVLTGSLAIDPGSTVNNSSGKVIVDAALALNGATISGGAIKGAGSIDVTVASKIDGNATLSTSAVTADAKLTLDGITVSGSIITDNSSIELDNTVKLQDGARIQGGLVTNNGTLEIAGAATLLNDVVTNYGTVKVDGSQTLTLSGTEISGGTVNGSGTIDVTVASKIDGGATLSTGAVTADAKLTLDGITVSGSVITDNSSIELDNIVKLKDGAKIQGGLVTNNSTLEIAGAATLLNDVVTNYGAVKVDGSQTLTLSGTEISGGAVNGSGTIDVTVASKIDGGATLSTSAVTADAKLTLDGITVSGSVITDNSSIELDDTVKLQGGARIQGGPVTNNGTLEIAGAATLLNDLLTNTGHTVQVDSGNTLALSGTEIIGGTIDGTGTIDVTSPSKIDGGATLSTSFVTVDASQTLTLDTVTVDGTTVTDKGSITLAGTVKLQNNAEIQGVSAAAKGAISNTGTLEITGAATLLNDLLTNTGHTVQVDSGDTLALSGTEIIGGTINGTGTIDVTATSKIDGGATLSTSFVTVDASQTLTLDTVTVDGTTVTDKGSITLAGTVKLQNNAEIQGVSAVAKGAISNTGTLEIAGAATLLNDVLTNTGHTVQVDSGDTLALSGTEIIGGTIDGTGTIDVTATSKIDGNATLSTSFVTVDASQTLTLDTVTVDGTTLTDKGSISLAGTVRLQNNAEIQGGSAKGAISNTGTLEIAGAATLLNDVLTNTGHTVQVDGGNTLALSGTEIIGGTIDGAGTIDVTATSKIDGNATLSTSFVTVDASQTLTLDTVTVDGTTVTDKGSISLAGTVRLQNNAEIQGGSAKGAISNAGTLEIAGAATLLNDVVTNTGHTVQVDGGNTLALSGTEIIGGTIDGTGTIDVTATSKIDGGATLSTSFVTVDASQTLTLDTVTVDGTTVTDKGSITLAGTVKLQNNAEIQGISAVAKGAISNTGTLEIAGAATLLNDVLTNTGHTVQVDGGNTLALSGTEIIGGTIDGTGTIDVTSPSKIDGGATLSTSFVTVDASQTLTLDTVTVDGTTVTDKGSITLAGTVKLQDNAEIQGASAASKGAISNAGTLEITGAATLLNDVLTNTGHTVQVDGGNTLAMSGTEIIGGTIDGTGTIDVTSPSKIDGGATLSTSFVTVDASQTLTLDDATVSGTAITNGGTVKVDANSKLTLAGASLTGGTLTISGTLASSGTTTIGDATISNSYLIEATLGGLLTLLATTPAAAITNGNIIQANGAELDINGEPVTNTGTLAAINDGTLKLIATKVTNTLGTVSVDAGSTLDLDGATIDGGTVTISGALESSGSSAINNANVTITGTVSITGGTLTFDPPHLVYTIVNQNVMAADGGEIDVVHDAITNTGILEAIHHGTLKLTGAVVTNKVGTVLVDATSALYLTGVTVNDGTLSNAGHLYAVSGPNTITAAVANTGTIEVQGGTFDLAGGLSGVGSLIIDNGATLELAGATAQTVTFNGGTDTLRLDKVAGESFSGTIAGQSSTNGTFTVTGDADVTTSTGDALDFTAGVGTTAANIVLTPTGTLTGALNGLLVTQNGAGNISLTATGDITGLNGNGIMLRDSATGAGSITVNDVTGKATGTGANSEGILVENLNVANDGDISITQLRGAAGDAFGIDAITQGDGNVTIDAGGYITGSSIYGIRARSYGAGDVTVTTETGSVITSGSSGIVAVNRAISLDASNDSTITVNAYGTINSGNTANLAGNPPAGIQAGYTGSKNSTGANTDVNGTVVVNNYADITTAAGSGIDAYNYGNGDVTVNSFAGTAISVSGTRSYGIEASALSGGTGDISITLDKNVTITGATAYGIKAYSIDAGDISVTMATGDSITSGSSGIVAVNYATAITSGVDSTISVQAHGTIHSGSTPNNDSTTPGGIIAGYKPGGNATFSNAVKGDVTVASDATITADAGYGIEAFTWGVGKVTVTTGELSSITAAGTAIGAFDHGGGDVSVTNEGSATGAVGLSAIATGAGNVTIVNDGDLTGTSLAGISVTQDDDGATGSTHITNTGSVVGATDHAAIYIQENATGTATITNSGTIGPDAAHVTATTYAIYETGGAIEINNSNHINGDISVASATFDNESGGTWTVSGTSVFGTLSTIDNAGEVDLLNGASVSSADGVTFAITNSGKIESWGTNSITGSITNTNTIEVHTGTLSLFGSLSGAGSVTIDANATLDVNATVSQAITFDGVGGELQIDTASFGGSVAGFAATDKLDLSTIKFDGGTSATYDAATGDLVVSDAYGHSIMVKLTGQDYSDAHFAGSIDGHGGTLITLNADDDTPAFTAAEASPSVNFSELDNKSGFSALDPASGGTGTIHFTDIDLTDRPTATITEQAVTWLDQTTQLTFSPDEIAALEQALTLQQSGNKNNGAIGWTYSVADSSLDFLGEGQIAKVMSTITLDDHHGDTATAEVTVLITGANDAPTVTSDAAAATGAVTEDTGATLSTGGTLAIQDLDLIDTHTATSVFKSSTSTVHLPGFTDGTSLGSFTIDPAVTELSTDTDNGATLGWHFSLDNSNPLVQSLAEGQFITEIYTVTFTDNHNAQVTQDVTVTIHGVNDAPTLDNATLDSVAGNESNPSGSTISDLFAGKFHDVDVGASFKAIAVSADHAASDQGVWQYEIAGTDQWVDVSGVSCTNALVLSSDTLIRFVPADGYTGAPGTLDVHALDDTYAGAVTTTSPVSIDITGAAHGGTTPVSDQAASISIDVTVPPDVLVANDDAVSNATTPSTADGWVLDSLNGHYYRLVTTVLSWDDAKTQAESDGGYLATITSQHEQDIVRDLAAGHRAWIGGGSTDDTVGANAHFSWLTGPEAGSPFGYTHWRVDSNEPNGGSWSTQYVHIEGVDDAANGGWNDAPGDATGRYFIEEWGGQQGQVAFKENVGTTLTTAQLLTNDTDSAGNPVSVTSVGDLTGHSAHGGTVTLDGNIIAYTPATDYFGADSFTYTISDGVKTSTATVSFTIDQSPVIDTTHFQHTHNEDNSDTITGLSVSGSSVETYTISAATAGQDEGSSVSPSSGDNLTLNQVNSDIASVTYNPGGSPPANDMITFTVTNDVGVRDIVNFIFNEAGDTENGITLTGTGGKDVIFATTTNDTLTGGGGKDQFVFAPGSTADDASHTITDFIEGLDKIDVRQFSGVASVGDLHITQQAGDTLVTWQQQITQSEGSVTEHEQLLLKNVTAALKASDFIFHIT